VPHSVRDFRVGIAPLERLTLSENEAVFGPIAQELDPIYEIFRRNLAEHAPEATDDFAGRELLLRDDNHTGMALPISHPRRVQPEKVNAVGCDKHKSVSGCEA
jgi:hypothetical protein